MTEHLRPADFVTVSNAQSPAFKIVGLLNGTPKVVSSSLGWEVVERPKREPFVDWRGAPILQLEIPMLFDVDMLRGHSPNPDVAVWRLERLSHPAGTRRLPLPIRLWGPRVPHATWERQWVIEQLAWGDNVIRGQNGAVERQDVVLTVLEYVTGDVAVRRARRSRRTRRYRVKRGDTLLKIAAQQLGNRRRWQQIYDLNRRRIRNPRKLKPGQILVLPP